MFTMRVIVCVALLLVMSDAALTQDTSGPRLDAACLYNRITKRAEYYPSAYFPYDQNIWTNEGPDTKKASICWDGKTRAPTAKVNRKPGNDRPRSTDSGGISGATGSGGRSGSAGGGGGLGLVGRGGGSGSTGGGGGSGSTGGGGAQGLASAGATYMAVYVIAECLPTHAAAPVRLCPIDGQWQLMYASGSSVVEGPLLEAPSDSGTNPVNEQPWEYEFVDDTYTLQLRTAYDDGKAYIFTLHENGRVEYLEW